jgi:hypothetical protein
MFIICSMFDAPPPPAPIPDDPDEDRHRKRMHVLRQMADAGMTQAEALHRQLVETPPGEVDFEALSIGLERAAKAVRVSILLQIRLERERRTRLGKAVRKPRPTPRRELH